MAKAGPGDLDFHIKPSRGSEMRVVRVFRFELDPDQEAQTALAKHIGTARFAFNWGLARCLEAMEKGGTVPSAVQLHEEWNAWKQENAPWWVEVSECVAREAFQDLEQAIRDWQEGRADFPRFRRKKVPADNKARLTGSIRVAPYYVELPRIGKVRIKERADEISALVQGGKARILSATISRETDRWFVSLTCEAERADHEPLRAGGGLGSQHSH